MANIPCLKKEWKRKAVKYNVVTITLLESLYVTKIYNYMYKTENNKLTFQTTHPVKNFHFQKAKQKFIQLINSWEDINKISC